MKKHLPLHKEKTLLLICFVLIFSNWNVKDISERETKESKKNLSVPEIINRDITNENDNNIINCSGNTFSVYPDINSIKNKEFAELLKKVEPVNISRAYYSVQYDPLNTDLLDFFYKETFNIGFKNYGYFDFLNRIDGEKLVWSPVAQLPTNGKFIMMILTNWEDVIGYDPTSSGFFLCTFKLSGELQSMIYLYGREEFTRCEENNDILTSIVGRAYCLNTDRPIVRKATYWDGYSNRGGYRGCTLEIKEIKYIISEYGIIQIEDEDVFFPKKELKWIDRKGISFSDGSDTVKKMLGDIK
jgi:hypothetical protein